MELSLAIREGLYEALNGAVIYDGNPIEVFDAYALPQTAQYPYILLSTQNQSQRLAKCIRPQDAQIQVEVVHGFLEPRGFKIVEELMEQVDNIINPNTRDQIDITAKGYKIGNTYRTAGPNLTSKNDVYYVYRKISTYEFIISTL